MWRPKQNLRKEWKQQLQVQDVVDTSRQISNFLHDPQFDAHLAQMREAGEDENVLVSFQSYDRLGKMLDRGLASYILLSAKKVDGISEEALRQSNRAALTNLLAYGAQTSGSSSIPTCDANTRASSTPRTWPRPARA